MSDQQVTLNWGGRIHFDSGDVKLFGKVPVKRALCCYAAPQVPEEGTLDELDPVELAYVCKGCLKRAGLSPEPGEKR